jgi:hypothetical protein
MNHFVLMGIGVSLSIASIFTFSLGWQMWRDSLEMAYVSGLLVIEMPGWRLKEPLEVRLTETNGTVRATSLTEEDGRFSLGPISPGAYYLDIISEFVRCQKILINLNKGSKHDLGAIRCIVNERANWNRRFSHSQLLSVAYVGDTTWLTGFKTDKGRGNSYVLFRANKPDGKFESIIVSKAIGAERGRSITAFETGELVFATYGKGAFISNDDGTNWEPLQLPNWVKSVRIVLERKPGNWIIVAAGVPDCAEISQGVQTDTVFETHDYGTSWVQLGQLSASTTSFLVHSSGHLIAGSESVFGSAGIRVSKDGGFTWSQAQLPFKNPIRGIGVVKELSDGRLVAGTMQGRHWKNTYLDGQEFEMNGAIISSIDKGLTWQFLGERGPWKQVEGIAELPDNTLVASSGESLIWSTDRGYSWASFGKQFSCWVRDVGVSNNIVYVLSTDGLQESPLTETITRYATRTK